MGTSITVTDVKAEDVDILWPKVKDYLQRAIDKNQGEFNLDDVHNDLISENARLWIAYNEEGELLASAICEIQVLPRQKVCFIKLLGGEDFSSWSHTINAIEEWALDNGAERVTAYARKGFRKLMKAYDYEEVYTVISRRLSERRIH